MKTLKVCFIGVGSIAKRHIRNLHEIMQEQGKEIYIDVVRREKNLRGLDIVPFIRNVYSKFDELDQKYDAIFITNPTHMHLDSLEHVKDKAKAFFIEKPLTSIKGLCQAEKITLPEDTKCYIACPLRYTKVLQYLKKTVDVSNVRGVRCISSSYLPEWRPGVDYRNTYSANKDMGGGVSVDLIHEWDYIRYLFGMPKKIVYCYGKKSELELNCEDTALYIAEYGNMFLELHLDYFGRKTIREIMIFTDEDTIVGDLVNSKVTYLKSGESIDFGDERDDFQKEELRHFLAILESEESDNSILEACQTIRLTQGALEE